MAWRAKRLFLHIGAPRTGSSALQLWLRSNRSLLIKNRILYPQIMGESFVAAMAPAWPRDIAQQRLGIAGPRRALQLRRDVSAALVREVEEAQPEVIIVSAEQFFDRLDKRAVRRNLQSILAPMAQEIRVLVYLRRQDEAIYSRHWNSARLGRGGDFVTPGRALPEYDYERRLRPWARMFGRDSIIVKPFERPRLTGGSVVADVLGIMGCDPVLAVDNPDRNSSLDLVRAEFMQRISTHIGNADQVENFRDDLNWAIDRIVADWPKPVLPARDARMIVDLYSEANARLSAVWGDGGEFFDQNVTDQPAADTALGTADVIEIAAQLWIQKVRQIRKLRRRVNGSDNSR